jgi:hypothetical protein
MGRAMDPASDLETHDDLQANFEAQVVPISPRGGPLVVSCLEYTGQNHTDERLGDEDR